MKNINAKKVKKKSFLAVKAGEAVDKQTNRQSRQEVGMRKVSLCSAEIMVTAGVHRT